MITGKCWLISLTKYTASFWGQYGIRCNAISPGAFPNTESQSSNSVDKNNSTFLNKLADRTVLGRVGKPKDLIGALILLSSDASDYITGQVLQVDGGWTITWVILIPFVKSINKSGIWRVCSIGNRCSATTKPFNGSIDNIILKVYQAKQKKDTF